MRLFIMPRIHRFSLVDTIFVLGSTAHISTYIHTIYVLVASYCKYCSCGVGIGLQLKPQSTALDQETHLAQTQFRKTEAIRNHPDQNVLVTRTQAKTLYKKPTSHI
jgi:hypothetical protein